ncbi:hypothetical protein C7H19_15285 [Aphanothece hegewaldii CCALA 016]|uniref:DUF928 domain-containing protein n=1 Tax=Aphanothece hegewaldii CCALA 016 TaxID=2107694 RepID=A0A2T1LVN3_9CHRO|nr:DUF928 domain-containing protein [Aphanothece hegewaldii]PSF35786.1 hypothetical protein C7H19_15285 [Aphanothece hegewaldii CCALA 016]
MNKVLVGVLLTILSISYEVEARPNRKIIFTAPTDRKRIPQRISSSMSRGCQRNLPKVTLLTPPEYVGTTSSKQTRVFIYFEEKPIAIPIYLTLSKIDESQALIEKQIEIEQKGVTQIELPIELEVNQVYQWSITLVCQSNSKRIDENEEVSGLIERVNLPQFLSKEISQASRWEKANLYASYGIWHESLKATQNTPQFNELLTQVGIKIENR